MQKRCYTQLGKKVPKDFFTKLGKISILVSQVLKFCDSDAKENPDGFLSHYLSLRNLWSKRFFDNLAYFFFQEKVGRLAMNCLAVRGVRPGWCISQVTAWARSSVRSTTMPACSARRSTKSKYSVLFRAR